jgi:hypothetical protein
MIVDKALANFCVSSEIRRSGDAGRRRVEHRKISELTLLTNYLRFRSD